MAEMGGTFPFESVGGNEHSAPEAVIARSWDRRQISTLFKLQDTRIAKWWHRPVEDSRIPPKRLFASGIQQTKLQMDDELIQRVARVTTEIANIEPGEVVGRVPHPGMPFVPARGPHICNVTDAEAL